MTLPKLGESFGELIYVRFTRQGFAINWFARCSR